MTRRSVRYALLALTLAGVVACAHDDRTTAATATTAATGVASVAAVAPSMPETAKSATARTTVDDRRESVSKNGEESAMGVATERDLAQIGLPIYPTVTLGNTFLVKHVDRRSAAFRLQVSVKDGIGTVSDWYAKRLGPSFAMSRMNALGGITSFSRKSASANESVLLQAQRDANLNIPLTTLTITVTKRR